MRPDAVAHLAGHRAHHRVDGSQQHRDVGVVDRSGVEQRDHQVEPVVVVVDGQRHPVLPGPPDGPHGEHVVAHPRCRRSPRHAVATLDVALHLRAQTECEPTAATAAASTTPSAPSTSGCGEGDRHRRAETERGRGSGRRRRTRRRDRPWSPRTPAGRSPTRSTSRACSAIVVISKGVSGARSPGSTLPSGSSVSTRTVGSGTSGDELRQLHIVVGCDHLGRFLADHDRGRVGVAADDVGHDAGIGDAQIGDADDSQPVIDDASHPARAGEVIHRPRVVAGQVSEQVVARGVAGDVGVFGRERWRDQQWAEFALVRASWPRHRGHGEAPRS